jgi:hypothetical protein
MGLRGVLPTFVSDQKVVLCKAAPIIRNAYEIRLALYMAVKHSYSFILAVKPDAQVDAELEGHISEHGGSICRTDIQSYSVYVGAIDSAREEMDGWVAGSNQAWDAILADLHSDWLRERLRVGAVTASQELDRMQRILGQESFSAQNIDGEDLCLALITLADQASRADGCLFVQ